LAGTGIPEYSDDSGVISDSGVQPKGGSRKKIPPEKTRINRNPEESWAGTKNRTSGKCNLGRHPLRQGETESLHRKEQNTETEIG
jgi:hypothetical protein